MTETKFGYLTPENAAMFTDLYELRMMQGYFNREHNPRSTFNLFFRSLPAERGYMLTAGLEQAIHHIKNISFTDRTITYLDEQGFDEAFLEYLSGFEFTGEVRALPEGTPVFQHEPMLEITAPILQAQLFETVVINQIGFQTLIATKASRMRDVVDRHGEGQSLVDFGSRRAHGTDAGIKAARAAYIAGFDATSNVAAGELFDIPVAGTMAHSWIQSFESEREAFETFAREHGEESILLIDTYDTIRGGEIAAEVVADTGIDVRGVRLDTGDLPALSRKVADVIPDLDQFISSGMDEYAIREFYDRDGIGVGFGPGTALVTSRDTPSIDVVYKLVSIESDGEMRPTMKLSTGKLSYPGSKSIRRRKVDGQYSGDVIGLRGESLPGEEQLVTMIEDGELVVDLPELETIRSTARGRRRAIPLSHRRIEHPEPYEVELSNDLQTKTEDLRTALEQQSRA